MYIRILFLIFNFNKKNNQLLRFKQLTKEFFSKQLWILLINSF